MADRKPKYNALVSSAALIEPDRRNQPKHAEWQEEAWDFYDVGEALYYGATWFGNGMSRARLLAAKRPVMSGEKPSPVSDGPAAEAVEALAGGVGGRSRMMKSFGVHLTVAGQCYLVAETAESGDTEWQVLSADELRVHGNHFEIKDEFSNGTWRPLAPDSLVARVWRPHERFHWQADSPTKHVLPALREFKQASEQIEATLVSRLTGAGVYWIPSEATFQAPEGTPEDVDPFAAHLIQVMSTAIKDRGSAAAVTPLVSRMKADLIEKIRHDTFDSSVDDKAVVLREAAIRRAATGLDMPPEVLLGLADVNHWSAWQIQDSGVQWHLEPTLELICHALTISYLQPALEAQGVKDAEDYTVWFDVSELTTRPDRSADAFKAYDRMEIDGDALRRETGLSDSDKPTDDELKTQAFLRMLSSVSNALIGLEGLGFVPPGTAAAATAAKSGNGEMPVIGEGGDGGAPGEGVDIGEDPQPTGAQEQGPPHTGPYESGNESARVAAAFPIAYRALERAGNRARTRLRSAGKLNGQGACPAALLHTHVDFEAAGLRLTDLLDGSAEEAVDVAVRLGLDPAEYAQQIIACVAGLIQTQTGLDWEAIERALL